jgi:HEPN domain
VTVDEKVLGRLDELIELGRKVLATRRAPAPNVVTSDFVDVQLTNQWMTSCLSLIARVLGDSSIHYKRLDSHFNNYPKWSNVSQAFGVLLAAKEDYEKEALFEIKHLIEAELFSDFLEQAEYLLANGYYAPAAVIAGSVLEDGLRKACLREEIPLPTNPKLDQMNAELAKRGMYNKLTQKRLTALADIRNSAAHGRWADFQEADARDMIRDVRNFMEKYF